MSEITRWVFTICCGAMLCGIASILSPGKSSERLMGMVLGLFMLCCFLLPAGLDLKLELTGQDLSDASSAMESAAGEITRYFLDDAARRAQEELRQRLEQELAGTGINEEDLQIYIEADDPGEDNGLAITATVILPARLRDRLEVRRLEEALGIAVELRYREEDDREGL